MINSAIGNSCRHLESLQSLALVILHFSTCGKAGPSNSKILSEGNVWEHSVCISFVVEVNQNTQGTQKEFSYKLRKFCISSQPQGYELSHLHTEQHAHLQDWDSQLLLIFFEKQCCSFTSCVLRTTASLLHSTHSPLLARGTCTSS